MSPVVIVLSTWPAGSDAAEAAKALVGERLAACVSISAAMTSVYRWEGRVDEAAECQLVIKSTEENLAALETRLTALHPYEVPEFLVLRASSGSDAYLGWLRGAVLPPR